MPMKPTTPDVRGAYGFPIPQPRVPAAQPGFITRVQRLLGDLGRWQHAAASTERPEPEDWIEYHNPLLGIGQYPKA